jgi:hypothetical protein
LGGWYSFEMFEGHALGQWMSALARYYGITGDDPTRAKIERLLAGLSPSIGAIGGLYRNTPSAYLYTMLSCGLSDAQVFTHQPLALDVLARATDAIVPHLPRAASVNMEEAMGFNYMVPENQFIAWQRGAPARHLEIAKQFLLHEFFDPLARGENALPGRHAYVGRKERLRVH